MAEDWRKLFFTPKKKHINDLLLLFRSALILKPKKLRVKPLLRLVSTAYKLKFKQRYLSNAEREGFEPLLQCVLCQSHRKTNSRNSWITPKWCYQKAVAGFCTLKLQFSFVFQKLLGLHSLGVPVKYALLCIHNVYRSVVDLHCSLLITGALLTWAF